VQRKEGSDAVFTNVIDNFDYSPIGQPSSIAYANGVATANTYDPDKLYRLSHKISILPSVSKAQDLEYSYDAIGNITRITDLSDTNTAKTIDYDYDDLSRLLSASTTAAADDSDYRHGYTYNPLGNIISGPIGNYAYDGNIGASYANPHAVTSIAVSTTTPGSGISTSTIEVMATSTSITNGYDEGPVVKNWTHAVTGENPLLVLYAGIWQDEAGTGSITSASYGGVPLTKATSTRSFGIATEVWYLANPANGTNTLSIAVTGITDAIKLAAVTYGGFSTSSPLESVKTVIGSTGNPSITFSASNSGDLISDILFRYTTTNATTSATPLFKDVTGSTLMAGSYQIASTTGDYTNTYSGTANQDWSISGAVFKPAVIVSGEITTTTIATVYTYDNNGNLTSDGVWTHSWDLRNRMIGSAAGTSTLSYRYDHADSRISYYSPGKGTTTIANRYFETNGATSTRNIYAGDILIGLDLVF